MNRQLFFMTACDMEDGLIAIDALGQGVFQIDKQDMTSHLLTDLQKMNEQHHVYQATEQYHGEVFFFPRLLTPENPIPVYHVKDNCIEYFTLKGINSMLADRYERVCRVDDCVWMFPADFGKDLVKFHLDTRKIEIIPQWKKAMKNISFLNEDTFSCVSNVIEVDSVLYHVIKGTNYILSIDKEEGQIERYTLPINKKLFVQIDYDGESFWITDTNHQGIISWNLFTRETRYFPIILPEGENIKRDRWNKWISYILCGKKYLWIIPQKDNKLVKLSYETGQSECVYLFPQEFCLWPGNERMIGMIKKGEDIVDLYPFYSNLVIHLDLKNDVLLDKHEQILLPDEWSEAELINYQICNELETNRVPFGMYLDAMMQKGESEKEKRNCSIGESIWNYIKI